MSPLPTVNSNGKKIIDISKLVEIFDAPEGEIRQIIGKTGNGKTYEGTRQALDLLRRGQVVYTSWQLILPDVYDEREHFSPLFWRFLFFRKNFYVFDFKKNWHHLDIERPDLIEFVGNLTDCYVFLDEGQDIFDSRGKISARSRRTITRTRHFRKTIIIISQRAQAVDVTARANVTYFLRCKKTRAWFWPFSVYFKVYITEEMDNENYPIWEEMMPGGKMWYAPVWHSHFASKDVYEAYNSWYLRKGIVKSQEVNFEAYELGFTDRLRGLFGLLLPKKRQKAHPRVEPSVMQNPTHIEDTMSIPRSGKPLDRFFIFLVNTWYYFKYGPPITSKHASDFEDSRLGNGDDNKEHFQEEEVPMI